MPDPYSPRFDDDALRLGHHHAVDRTISTNLPGTYCPTVLPRLRRSKSLQYAFHDLAVALMMNTSSNTAMPISPDLASFSSGPG